MLKTAANSDFERLCAICKNSVFGTYIICRAKAYGFERSFAEIYLCENDNGELTGAVSVLDNNAVVVANEHCNFEELAFFVSSFGFSSVLTDEVTAEKCGFHGAVIKTVLCFDTDGKDFQTDSAAEMKKVYELFCSCFPQSFSCDKNSYLSWLSDFTFRKNRGLSRLKAVSCGEAVCAAAVTSAECCDGAVISAVACGPEYRKRGYGKAVTLSLANELKRENKTVYVISQDESTTHFYMKLGFRSCGSAAYIERL